MEEYNEKKTGHTKIMEALEALNDIDLAIVVLNYTVAKKLGKAEEFVQTTTNFVKQWKQK